MDTLHGLVCAVPASFYAFPAGRTGFRAERNLACICLRFGVVAPNAAQRAAFQENGRTDARAVMEGSTLDVEDHTGNSHGMEIQINTIMLIMGYYTRFCPFSPENGAQICTICAAANRVYIHWLKACRPTHHLSQIKNCLLTFKK
jgi:hypothetical protein